MTTPWAKLRRFLGMKPPADPERATDEQAVLGYLESRELARHKDPEVRRSLASRSDLRPEILYYLAGDPSPEVRRKIAANLAAPAQADFRLAADEDPSVRGDLAQKIARLAPGLSADEQDRLRRLTYDTLQLLARDQITRVRQILAEALKDVAHAPAELIRQLAHDSELEVASPVLQYSPVLSDEDLLEIVQSSPVSGALSAISRRIAVAATVADAIARTDDVDAIAVLLVNPSAQIREETLDMLLERAPAHEEWHGPLVRRPQLSARAATRLARFVAENLIEVLNHRTDIDDETKAVVAAVVRRRVEEGGSDMAAFHRGEQAASGEALNESAEQFYRAGRLDEAIIMSAVSTNNMEFVISALALRAKVSLERASKIVATQSAKGLTSLAWRAGLSMPAAVSLQIKLAKIAPADVVKPRVGTDGYPLSAEEMSWQLEFFASMVGDVEPKTVGDPTEFRAG